MPITNEMESPGASGRRRVSTRTNAEDQALDQIAKEVSDTSETSRFPLNSDWTSDVIFCRL